MTPHYARLLPQRLVTKRMTQTPPKACMIAIVRNQDMVCRAVRSRYISVRTLHELATIGVGVDVRPCGGVDEGELVGCNAQQGSVLLVQTSLFVVQSTGDEGVAPAEAGGAPEKGTGIVAEWVEVEVVDDCAENVE